MFNTGSLTNLLELSPLHCGMSLATAKLLSKLGEAATPTMVETITTGADSLVWSAFGLLALGWLLVVPLLLFAFFGNVPEEESDIKIELICKDEKV